VLHIRRLKSSDLGFAMQLVEIAGWNQLPADWSRLLHVDPEGCFLAQWNGQPAGTATAIAYGTDCAWIGMVLVHPDYRGQGIGGGLIGHCLDHLKSLGVRVIKLDATDQGRPVYVKEGFVDEYGTLRYLGQPRLQDLRTSRYRIEPVAPCCGQTLEAMDEEAFGANRSALLRAMAEAQPDLSLIAIERGGEVVGYGFARPGRLHGYIGPVVAQRMDVAQALVAELSRRLSQKTVLIDTTALNPTWRAWLEASGFQLQRRLMRMYRGTNDSPGDTSLAYALSAFETG